MDRDLTPRDDPLGSPDDAQLGALVRAVADDWQRPPQRLDVPTWRERVEVGRRGARGSGGRRWFGRLAGAGMLAVVATVVLAVTAVYLTGPRQKQGVVGASASPTEGASPSRTPGRSAPPVASPLPALVVNGDLPSVTSILLQGSGGYRYADLTTGSLEPDLPFPGGDSGKVLPRPGGGWVCVCITYVLFGSGSPTSLEISLKAVDAAGVAQGPVLVRTVTSEAADTTNDFMQVDVHVDASPDGKFANIGSTHRTATGWRAALDQVDLTSLRVVDTIAVPDVNHSADAGGRSWVQFAPSMSERLDGNTSMISSQWYVDDPTTSRPASGTDRWSGGFFGAAPVAIPATKASTDSCGDWEQGLIDDGSFFVACIDQAGNVHVGRFQLDGTPIDDTDVGRWTGFGVNSARNGSHLFLWDAQTQTLVRYDLATGRSDKVTAPKTGAIEGPLDAIGALGRAVGHWIAPSVTAKIFLQPAMTISPDGSTLYGLGIDGAIESLGSSGIFAFDIGGDTMTFKSHWEPTADFISIAVSEDGAFVYAAGMGGVDASGTGNPAYKPSVTVFDASDGSIRLIAGQLGGNELFFVEPTVR